MSKTPSPDDPVVTTDPRVVYVMQEADPVGREKIDVGELIKVIWRRKWWIAVSTALITLLGVAYALLATQWFRAEATLLPRDGRSGSGLSAQLVQFGGLAEIAGLGLGQSVKQEPLGVLQSRGFAQRFIEQNRLEAVLAARAPLSVSHERNGKVPDVRDAVDRFVRSVMFVSEDKRTGLVTIAIEWQDAAVAADWANKLAQQVNEEMRRRALDEATRNISYLRAQLETTDTVSLQQAIARLLEGEMQKAMLAQGAGEFAFRVIDEAKPPLKRSRPKRVVLVIIALMAGLALSTLGALAVDPVRELMTTAKGDKAPV